jgi:hypothetical protein
METGDAPRNLDVLTLYERLEALPGSWVPKFSDARGTHAVMHAVAHGVPCKVEGCQSAQQTLSQPQLQGWRNMIRGWKGAFRLWRNASLEAAVKEQWSRSTIGFDFVTLKRVPIRVVVPPGAEPGAPEPAAEAASSAAPPEVRASCLRKLAFT